MRGRRLSDSEEFEYLTSKYDDQGEGAECAEQMEREISQEAQCGECDCDLFQIGTFYACQQPACSRYAVPVNEYGNTDAEQEEEDARRGEQQDADDLAQGYDVPGVFGYTGRDYL